MRKILLVDADKQVTSLLKYKLSSEGFEVKCLESTINSIHILKKFMPDLIVSEMDLPEQSGVDFLKRVKVNPELSEIPFMFLSSSRKVEDKILAHEMGAEGYFTKPILIKVLINRIKDIFSEQEFNSIVTSGESKKSFDGRLMNITLLDLLNIVNENGKKGKITINADSRNVSGDIFFKNNSLYNISVSESSRKLTGKKGLFALLSVMSGTFKLQYDEETDENNMNETLDTVLLEATEWLDSYTSGLGNLPPSDTKLYIDFSEFFENLPKMPDDIGAIIKPASEEGKTVESLIEESDAKKDKAVEYISKLISMGVLTENREKTENMPDIDLPNWLDNKSSEDNEEILENNFEDVAPPPDMPGTGDDNAFIEKRSEEDNEEQITETKTVQGSDADTEETKNGENEDESVEEADKNNHKEKKAENIEDESLSKLIESVENEDNLDGDEESELDQEDIDAVDSVVKDAVEDPRTNTLLFAIIVAAGIIIVAAFYYFRYAKAGEELKKNDVVESETLDEEPFSPFYGKSFKELNELANSTLKDGDPDKAFEIYEAALAKLEDTDRKNISVEAAIRNNMALACYYSDRFSDALAEIEKSILLEKNIRRIELKVAVLEELKRYDEAVKAFEEAISDKSLKLEQKEIEKFQKEIDRIKKENSEGD
ncbi:MAG: response regulator [bacterium]